MGGSGSRLHDDLHAGEWGWKIHFVDPQLGFVSLENFDDGATLKTTDGGSTGRALTSTTRSRTPTSRAATPRRNSRPPGGNGRRGRSA